MTMVMGQGSERVEIILREIMPADSPAAGDRRVEFTLTCREFTAANVSAWISGDAWARFARELHALEELRQGEATLVSQSPADLSLRLYTWDRAGHMAAEGHLGAYHAVAAGMRPVELSFALDLDAGRIGDLVRAFDALAPCNREDR
jgi:hypothetical protein